MSANNAEPTGEVKDPEEPILGDNGVNYDSYATDGNIAKSNNTDLNFDSKEFERRQKQEYFVNVAGAEKLKREEERREAIAEKRRIREINHADKESRMTAQRPGKRDDYKGDKELRRISKQQKRAEWNKWWRSHRKKIFIVFGSVVALVTIIYFIVKPHIDNAVYTNDVIETAEGVQDAATIKFEAKKILRDHGYSEAVKYFEDKLESSTGGNKVYVAIYYAEFVYDYTENLGESIRILDSVRDINRSSLADNDYLHAYIRLYEDSNNIEEAKKISEEFGVEYVEDDRR